MFLISDPEMNMAGVGAEPASQATLLTHTARVVACGGVLTEDYQYLRHVEKTRYVCLNLCTGVSETKQHPIDEDKASVCSYDLARALDRTEFEPRRAKSYFILI